MSNIRARHFNKAYNWLMLQPKNNSIGSLCKMVGLFVGDHNQNVDHKYAKSIFDQTFLDDEEFINNFVEQFKDQQVAVLVNYSIQEFELLDLAEDVYEILACLVCFYKDPNWIERCCCA